VDRTGELYDLLEAAIGDLHLLITEPFLKEGVASAPTDAQVRAGRFDLEFLNTNPREVKLYGPTGRCAIDVRWRIPESPRRADISWHRHHDKSVAIRHGQSIKENGAGWK